MKKRATERIALLLIILISLSQVHAQELSVDTSQDATASETADSSHKVRYINDVSGKVLRTFYKTFGDKPGVSWSKTIDNSFLACYKENNKSNYVYFSNSGAVAYTLSHYSEEQLPKNIRHIIKSNFYDYAITDVSEVHKNDSVLFFVTLMDKTSVKMIRLMDGEWEIIKDPLQH